MKDLMEEYLRNYKELESLSRKMKLDQELFRKLQDRNDTIAPQLSKSVQPVCGSATMPHIRTYVDGQYTTLTVHWDGSLQRGRISVTENEG